MDVDSSFLAWSSLSALREPALGVAQSILLVIGAGGVLLVAISTISRRMRKAARRGSTPNARKNGRDEESAVIGDIEEAIARLDETARQIHGRLDTRLARLEALIADADQRIDRLSRSIRAADGRPTVDITLGAEGPDAPAERNDDIGSVPAHAAVHRLADGGLGSVEIAKETGKTPGEIELILALRRTRNGLTADPLRRLNTGR